VARKSHATLLESVSPQRRRERRGFAERRREEKRMRRVEDALVLSSSLRDLCVLCASAVNEAF